MNLDQYLPRMDHHGRTAETPDVYAERMRSTLLPNWPTEVLVEWPFQYPEDMAEYGFFGFERMRFQKVIWELERIPGVEVYDDPRCFTDYQTIDEDAKDENNWLPRFMKEHGTWKAPVILLKYSGGIPVPLRFGPLRTPLHLIEGRRRLSYLNTLRDQGRALSEHEFWLVTVEE